jgi:hypothetical protein
MLPEFQQISQSAELNMCSSPRQNCEQIQYIEVLEHQDTPKKHKQPRHHRGLVESG